MTAGAKGIVGELQRDVRRVLVIRAGALGDVILTFPALEELRRSYPDACIDVVGYPAFWKAAGDLIDGVESIDHPRFSGLFSGQPGDDLRAWLEGVDLAIAWTARDPAVALQAAGVPKVIHASPYPPPGTHAATWLVGTLSSSQNAEDRPTGVARTSASVIDRSRSIARRDTTVHHGQEDAPASCREATGVRQSHDGLRAVADAEVHATFPGVDLRATFPGDMEGRATVGLFIHPGAGATWKRWPAERFAALAQEARARGLPVALVEGLADEDAVRAVQELAGPLSVLRGLTVRELARELHRGQLFVGNDSGVTHLAAWLGVRTVALFGPTDPTSWAPLGDVLVLRACTARARKQGEIRVCRDPDCMARISTDAVLETVFDGEATRRNP